MNRAIAAGRMGGDIIGGNGCWRQRRHRFLHRAIRGRLILRRDVIEHRRQPAFGFRDRHALARGIVLDLVALDLADAEIKTLRTAKIKPGDRRAGPHRKILGQLDACGVLGVEQLEQRRLLGVIRLRGIAGRWADTLIFFQNQILGRQRLVRRVAPEFRADALVHPLGKGFRQAIRQRLAQDRGVTIPAVTTNAPI